MRREGEDEQNTERAEKPDRVMICPSICWQRNWFLAVATANKLIDDGPDAPDGLCYNIITRNVKVEIMIVSLLEQRGRQ